MLYSQWFAGALNEVADSLSCDHHLPDSDLLILLHSQIPAQIPEGFRICPLPPSIVSKIMTCLCNLLPAMQSPTAPVQSKITTGDTGSTSSSPLNLMSDYPFLTDFSQHEKHQLITCFAASVQANDVHQGAIHGIKMTPVN